MYIMSKMGKLYIGIGMLSCSHIHIHIHITCWNIIYAAKAKINEITCNWSAQYL